jgi:Ca2+-binding EF-hand superfamily protein
MFGAFHRRTALATLAALGISLVSGAAIAQETGQKPENRFIWFYDANQDSKVSLAEITDEKNRLIAAADVNGDGVISVDEFRRHGRSFMRFRATTLFDLMDINGDGQLTTEEIVNPSARWFARYDVNSDGLLDSTEVPARRFRPGGGPR